MSRYIISDTHLGHNSIHKFRDGFSSAEDHHDRIYEGLCKIPKRATLFLLGDIAFTPEWLQKIKDLPCQNKILLVGNHDCISLDTDVLTIDGWVKAEDVKGWHMVATKDLSSGVIEYVKPSSVSIQQGREMYSVKSRWQDELVSNNHRCIVDNKRTPVEDVDGESVRNFQLCGQDTLPDLYDSYIVSLITWVVCDGCIVQGETERKKRVQFKLSKPRKIEALESLLNKMGVTYTKRTCKKTGLNKLQPYYIRIYGDWARKVWELLGGVKKFPKDFMWLSGKSFRSFIETINITDGSRQYNVTNLVTVNKEDADTIQTCMIRNNYNCSVDVYENRSGFSNGKLQYKLQIGNENHRPIGGCKVEKQEGLSDVVAITVKHGTLITRRNGKVHVTGNCDKRSGVDMKMLCDTYEKVYSLHKYKAHWMSHAPIHPMELRGKKCVHGHTHHHLMLDQEGNPDSNYINVCVEYTGLDPITWDYVTSKEYHQQSTSKWKEYIK